MLTNRISNYSTKFIHWQASSGVPPSSHSVNAVDSRAPVASEPHVLPSTDNRLNILNVILQTELHKLPHIYQTHQWLPSAIDWKHSREIPTFNSAFVASTNLSCMSDDIIIIIIIPYSRFNETSPRSSYSREMFLRNFNCTWYSIYPYRITLSITQLTHWYNVFYDTHQ